jgi:hypothetical protein
LQKLPKKQFINIKLLYLLLNAIRHFLYFDKMSVVISQIILTMFTLTSHAYTEIELWSPDINIYFCVVEFCGETVSFILYCLHFI